jgi:hypothetical protein
MLCDVSEGGALVWGYWADPKSPSCRLELVVSGNSIHLDCDVVSVERLWDTVVLHLRFTSPEQIERSDLTTAIQELRDNFRHYQRYLAFRADDDPGLGRTSTQYPRDRTA